MRKGLLVVALLLTGAACRPDVNVEVGANNREESVAFSSRAGGRPTEGRLLKEMARYDPSGSAYLSAETRVPAVSGGARTGVGTYAVSRQKGGVFHKMNGAHVNMWGREQMALEQSLIKLAERRVAVGDDERTQIDQEIRDLQVMRDQALSHPEQVF